MLQFSGVRLVAVAAFASLLGATVRAQIGHVVGAQKISDTAGGFTATLDEEDQFGRSIVNLGDLDGDGVTDLLVGAHTDDDGGLDKGSVYVLFMHPNGFVKSWAKISDESGNFHGYLDPGDQFGRAAAAVGDLDLDGVVDVVVSSNYDDDGGTNKGAVYVLFLQTDGTVKRAQKISSTDGGLPAPLRVHDEFGRSITALGDLNGDGVCDILVGTPQDDDGGTNTGALHVLFLRRDGTVQGYRRISRSTDGLRLKPGDWFGHSSTSLGDFDGDGVTDIAVGAILDDDGGFNQGSIWILLLQADGSVKQAHEINELVGGFTGQLDDIDQFGTSIANIGDLDGDGVTDLIVGAVKDDDGGLAGNPDADVGAAWVLFLQADATVKSWVKISDTEGDLPYDLDQYDWFGSAVARLGGSPGDGLLNVAIGCRNDDDGSPNRGAIYLTQLNDGTAPIAGFSASRTLGVAPLTVAFTDTSLNEVTGWLWSFGDGAQSNLRNPLRTYDAPGTYSVSLTARGPRGRDTESRVGFITVVEGPLADFTPEASEGLAPLTVRFEDLSEGAITAWSWDFGDGTGSSEPAPSHEFGEGSFTVSLTVTGPKGTHTRTRADCVVARDLTPRADFEGETLSGFAPLAVQFTDRSGGLVTSWSWAFGDGQTSSEPNPRHTYLEPGNYEAELLVSSLHGSDAARRTIHVEDPLPRAAFAAHPVTGHAPLAVHFEDLSTGWITARAWSFGDGEVSSESSPLHVYQDPGIYSVSLELAGPHGGDVETRAGLIVVTEPPPQAEFQVTTTTGYAPFELQFTDQSGGNVTSWLWSFGDGQGSSEPSPTHVYAEIGTYSVSLTVSGPSGTDTKDAFDLVTVLDPAPSAAFDASERSGVAPLLVGFSDASRGLVTAWAWDFGDGATSAERQPEHRYEAPGSYDVRLQVSGPFGTDEVLRAAFVVVAEPAPLADFAAEPSTGFAPLAVSFSDGSHGSVSAWSWDFGDGGRSDEANPTHVYTAPGVYDVGLSVAGPGGEDARLRGGLVAVLDPTPVAEFASDLRTGVAPLSVRFADLSTGLVTAWSWDFGDGSTSGEEDPLHTFAQPGTYTVSLRVRGPAGEDVETKAGHVTVLWPAPVPEFTAGPVTGFAPLAVSFTDLSTGNVTSWTWRFGDGSTSRQRFPVKVYTRTGLFTVSLTVKGPGGSRTVSREAITVLSMPVLADGGFEQDSADTPPGNPWRVLQGTDLVTRSSATPDGGFPREGLQWCDIGASGSTAAAPPSTPGGEGSMPSGASALETRFPFASLAPHLVFDAAFLCAEPAGSADRNDFMSVDVSDGRTVKNIFHADTHQPLPGTSILHGLPMSEVRRVHCDLRALFPGIPEGTLLDLRVSVGNAGDGQNASRGYVDAFRLVPAATAGFRNGTGRNAARYVSSPAVLGGTWTIQVDTSGHAGARSIQLVGMQRPASGALRVAGEVLTSGKRLFAQSWPALPGLNVRTIQLPVDLSLLGQPMFTQVTITGGVTELCNAYDLWLGF